MDANWPNQVPKEAQDRRHGPLLFCSYHFCCFPSPFFSFGEPSPSKKKKQVKYPPCIAIMRFSLLYSNYQTLPSCSICQTSLPLYYLPSTSPCITLVTSFPCIVLVYDLSNASLLYIYIYISISFPFPPFHFLSFPFLSFALLSFPFLSNRMGGLPKAILQWVSLFPY